jgi:acetyl-CoA carboxylase beta subunit
MKKTKQCISCKKILNLSNFNKKIGKKWQGLRSKCKDCSNLDMKKNYSKNPIPQILSNAKIRSKEKNIFFDIDTEYLKSIFPKDNMCPVLNIPFQMGYLNENKKNRDQSPSLDRIVPEKGYVKGNLVFVCDLVNRVKSNSSMEILEKVLNFYKKIELTRTIK